MTTLGCLEEALFRVVRGGRVVYQTDRLNAAWGRVRNDISVGQFTLPASADCCAASVHARADLVEFQRNGEVAWAGYVQRPVETDGYLTVEAVDLLDGYQRRVIRDNINVTGTDIADIAAAVVTSADDGDPIPVVPIWTPTGILADRSYPASDYRIAWDALKNDLLNVGLDLTMVGTLLYNGPLEDRGLKPLKIRDGMLVGVPTKGEDGGAYANRVILKGGNGLVSIYPAGPPVAVDPYPLTEVVIDAGDVMDQASLDVLAKQHYDLRSAVPRFLAMDQGVTLADDSPYGLRSYIPGRLMDVGLTVGCTPIQQGMRLDKVDYTLMGGREEIKISAVPIGSVAAGVAA